MSPWGRLTPVIGAMAVAVLLASSIIWYVGSGRSLAAVEVAVKRPRCGGTTQARVRRDGVPQMRVRPGMRCRVRVVVSNTGDRAVRLERLGLPFMGENGGAAIRVGSVRSGRPLVAEPSPDAEARFVVDRDLAPGERWRASYVYVFRRSGCSVGLLEVGDLPRVEVRAWGRSRQVANPRVVAFWTSDDLRCSA